MKQKENKRTLREECALVWRAVRIWNKIMPGYWALGILCAFAEELSPYFGLFMSAQLVNELAGERSIRRLLILAAITVVGGFLLSLAIRFLQGRRNVVGDKDWQKHEIFLLESQNDFQYEHLENPDVLLKRAEIQSNMNAFGGGLEIVKWQLPKLISSLFNIIFSVSLTLSLFTMRAEGEFTGLFRFINSPASVLVVVGLIVIDTVCAIKILNTNTVKTREAIDDLAKENSRLFAYQRLWGSDLIVFNLNRVIMEEFRKYQLHPKWIEKSAKVQKKYGALATLLRTVLNIAIFLFTAAKAFIGAFGIGNFVLYQGSIERFIVAVSGLSQSLGSLKHNNRYLAELYDYLDLPNDMYKGSLTVEKRDDLKYEIEFRDVSFKYPRTDSWALRHVNMKFKIGDQLAIVGENGSGKTTFIKLLCRLYDPTEGKILLNGIDITRYRYHEYMELFSVVFQDYSLFGFPLGENVSAKQDYDAGRVRDCLIRVGMGKKIAQLDADPEAKEKDALKRAIGRQYDSEGIEFSGGEMQKIALARALYKDAPFVILDEPTAALDPIAEAAVYENFNTIVQNKTALYISHRLSSCRFCDEIAVFDKGQIIQRGSHDDLVADESGKYHELWHAQAQYYTETA